MYELRNRPEPRPWSFRLIVAGALVVCGVVASGVRTMSAIRAISPAGLIEAIPSAIIIEVAGVAFWAINVWLRISDQHDDWITRACILLPMLASVAYAWVYSLVTPPSWLTLAAQRSAPWAIVTGSVAINLMTEGMTRELARQIELYRQDHAAWELEQIELRQQEHQAAVRREDDREAARIRLQAELREREAQAELQRKIAYEREVARLQRLAQRQAQSAPQPAQPAQTAERLRARLSPAARRDAIAQRLAQDPDATAVQLAQAFGVSRRTAETDLAAVRNNNHGGAQ